MFLANKLAGSGSVAKTYVDDVFATNLYTGNGTSLSINNGIDLAGKGGMVWLKKRTSAEDHVVTDSARGKDYHLSPSNTNGSSYNGTRYSSFNNTGFTLGTAGSESNVPYVSYTFRKAPKFFDILTWTGNSTASRDIPHSLGMKPGLVITKCTNNTSDWQVTCKNTGGNDDQYLLFNSSTAQGTDTFNQGYTNIFASTATNLRLSDYLGIRDRVNSGGNTYVSYLFADDPSPDGLIRCGAYTGNGSATGATVDLGWEPQCLMVKNITGTGSWHIIDNQRGFTFDGLDQTIQANSSAAETAQTYIGIRSNGFQVVSTSSEVNTSGSTYIYMAIRRSNKSPTDPTKVFNLCVDSYDNPVATGNGGTDSYINKVDLAVHALRAGSSTNFQFADKVRGFGTSTSARAAILSTSSAVAETTTGSAIYPGKFGGYEDFIKADPAGANRVGYVFKRAAGFFDVVAYKSAGAGTVVKHSLGVIPQLVIIKSSKAAGDWSVGHNIDGLVYWSGSRRGNLNSTNTLSANTATFNPATATEVTPGQGSECIVDREYIMYLFATLPGISKVGIYTGNGSAMTINCGFVAGARFVMIKRTDATGDWCVFDTVRGITDEYTNDPVILMNSNGAETNTVSQLKPNALGFNIYQDAANNLNVLNATYIFLAIA